MNDKIKYFISQIIASLIVLILMILIYSIGWQYMPSLYWMPSPIIISLLAFGISFLTRKMSDKMISVGKSLDKRINRLLYYPFTLPIIIAILSTLAYSLLDNVIYLAIFANRIVLIALQCIPIAGVLFFVVPYLQSIIRVLLDKIK